MAPRQHLSDPESSLVTLMFRHVPYFCKACKSFNRSRALGETALSPFKYTSNMSRSKVEFVSLRELGAEILWIKGGLGKVTGGTTSSQSGGHLSPGGKCFAPF